MGLKKNPLKNDTKKKRSTRKFGLYIDGKLDMIENLEKRVAGVLASLPGQGGLSPWGKIPEGGNTTSTTKIIDGHVVTVNVTTYESGDENSKSVFRVRTVDVKPLNDTQEVTTDADIGGGEEVELVTAMTGQGQKEETTTQARSVETVEDFGGNEIPTNQNTLTA